jgi:hypothetical protein
MPVRVCCAWHRPKMRSLDRCHDQTDSGVACQADRRLPKPFCGTRLRSTSFVTMTDDEVFRRRLRLVRTRNRSITPWSLWQNGIVEQMIGSICRGCLDYVIVWSEVHLRRPQIDYAAYNNSARSGRGLRKMLPTVGLLSAASA